MPITKAILSLILPLK